MEFATEVLRGLTVPDGYLPGEDEWCPFKFEYRTHRYPGRLVVFEGTDGGGKTTLLGALSDYLDQLGIDHIELSTPSREIRETWAWRAFFDPLSSADLDRVHIYGLSIMAFADRLISQKKDVEVALASGKWVLCDRYNLTSAAHQSGPIHRLLTRLLLCPDLGILIDVDTQEALRRLGDRDYEELHPHEAERQAIARNRLKLLASLNGFVIIDTTQSDLSVSFRELKMAVDSIIETNDVEVSEFVPKQNLLEDVHESSSVLSSPPIEHLLHVIRTLRGVNGCPWDREQTARSLRQRFLEECYEVLDAIDKGDQYALADELGDVLVLIMFLAELMRESGYWSLDKITVHTINKLVSRHDHVFGRRRKTMSASEVERQWEYTKRSEKDRTHAVQDAPKGIPAQSLTALLQRKVESLGIDLQKLGYGSDALSETQLDSIRSASSTTDKEHTAGWILFNAVLQLRQLGVDPESALRSAAGDFQRRICNLDEALLKSESSRVSEKELLLIMSQIQADDIGLSAT